MSDPKWLAEDKALEARTRGMVHPAIEIDMSPSSLLLILDALKRAHAYIDELREVGGALHGALTHGVEFEAGREEWPEAYEASDRWYAIYHQEPPEVK